MTLGRHNGRGSAASGRSCLHSPEGLLEEPGLKKKKKEKHPVTSKVFSLFIQAGPLPLAQLPHIHQLHFQSCLFPPSVDQSLHIMKHLSFGKM